MKKFIVTKDINVRTFLIKQGFQELLNSSDNFVFLNKENITMTFDEKIKNKIVYTDMMYM